MPKVKRIENIQDLQNFLSWLLQEAKKAFKKKPSPEGAAKVAYVANILRAALEVGITQQDGRPEADPVGHLQTLPKEQRLERLREFRAALDSMIEREEQSEE